MKTTSHDRYAIPVIALHWLMLLLIATGYAAIELREIFPKESAPRESLKALHYMVGLTVLALIGVRILARLASHTPPITPAPPAWQTLAARIVHVALILFMIAQPLLGWLILSAEGEAIPFWGAELPALVGQDKELAEQIEEIHEANGKIGLLLIGLHTAAALYHHYVQKDNTLTRMLPALARR
jgi:cytochrome b561